MVSLGSLSSLAIIRSRWAGLGYLLMPAVVRSIFSACMDASRSCAALTWAASGAAPGAAALANMALISKLAAASIFIGFMSAPWDVGIGTHDIAKVANMAT